MSRSTTMVIARGQSPVGVIMSYNTLEQMQVWT